MRTVAVIVVIAISAGSACTAFRGSDSSEPAGDAGNDGASADAAEADAQVGDGDGGACTRSSDCNKGATPCCCVSGGVKACTGALACMKLSGTCAAN
jgi:hypothetical protein